MDQKQSLGNQRFYRSNTHGATYAKGMDTSKLIVGLKRNLQRKKLL